MGGIKVTESDIRELLDNLEVKEDEENTALVFNPKKGLYQFIGNINNKKDKLKAKNK